MKINDSLMRDERYNYQWSYFLQDLNEIQILFFFLFHQVEIHNQESGIIENYCLSKLTSTFGKVFHLPSPRLAVGIQHLKKISVCSLNVPM